MSKTPSPLNYPQNIQDHHTMVAFRQIIDAVNSHAVQQTINNNQFTPIHAKLDALPQSFVQPNDVNSQIHTWALTSLKRPPKGAPDFIQVLNSGLVQLGFSVPHPPPGADVVPAVMPAAELQALSAIHWGERVKAPTLAREEAGFLYYVVDYGHLAMWDGWAWVLLDGGGGYFVDTSAPIDLGVGYQICDGSTTDWIKNDTINLEVEGFTTPRYRPLRRGHRRYFRR